MGNVTVSTLQKLKEQGEKFVCITAYDATFSRLVSEAGAETILVGDSLGMVLHGHDSTVPVTLDDMVYHTTGWSKGQYWGFKVNPDLSANQDSVSLQLTRNISRKPIPIVHQNRIYTVDDGGVASCVDRLTGEDIWRERIGGNYSASPLLVNKRLYFQSEDGKTTVVAAADEFKKLAENQLESGFMASPAVDGNALILRTKTHLYRIEE